MCASGLGVAATESTHVYGESRALPKVREFIPVAVTRGVLELGFKPANVLHVPAHGVDTPVLLSGCQRQVGKSGTREDGVQLRQVVAVGEVEGVQTRRVSQGRDVSQQLAGGQVKGLQRRHATDRRHVHQRGAPWDTHT